MTIAGDASPLPCGLLTPGVGGQRLGATTSCVAGVRGVPIVISGPDPILEAAEVTADLRCSKAHVYNLIRGNVKGTPRLRAIKMGRRVVVRRSSLEQWKADAEAALTDATLVASPEVDAVGASRRNR